MKKILKKNLILLLTLLLLLLISCRNSDENSDLTLTPTVDWLPNYSLYENEAIDLQFNYPPGWSVDDSEANNGIIITSNPSLVNFEFGKYPGAAILIFNQIDLERTGNSAPLAVLQTFLNSTIQDGSISIIKQPELITINGHSAATSQIFGPLFNPNLPLFATVRAIRVNHRVLIVLSATPEALTLDYLMPIERTISTINNNTSAPPVEKESAISLYLSPDQLLQFEHPQSWVVKDDDYPFAITVATRNELLTDPDWKKNKNDLIFTIYPNPNNQTSQTTLPEDSIQNFINKQLKNDFLEIVSHTETSLINNQPVAKKTVRLSSEFDGQKFLMDMQLIAINIAEQEFLIVALSPEHATNQFGSILDQIITSLSIK